MSNRSEPAGRSVRWKQGTRWHYGHLDPASPVETDGSLRVYDDHNGATRSLHPETLQEQVRGRRGGRRWEPVEDVDLILLTPDVARREGW